MNQSIFFVYIVKNNNIFYVGLTNNLTKILSNYEKQAELVYYEKFDSIETALNREKQIKKFSRNKKIKLFS